MSVSDVSLFSGKDFKVHKFGGTSVASAECFLRVASIIEHAIGVDDPTTNNNKNGNNGCPNLAIVASAMGGKPKTTDLLLSTVEAAAARDDGAVEMAMETIMDKHSTCLDELFAELPEEKERLLSLVSQDLTDIKDILKTVSLMKWKADRISELVSGYGELWSTQILAALLQMRSRKRELLLNNSSSQSNNSARIPDDNPVVEDDNDLAGEAKVTHEFVYVDARRVIILDEDAIQHGAVCWDISQAKLQDVYEEGIASVRPSSIIHLVMTGYVASNTHGVATTLQRDGSDYSAAILGRLLQATEINIWTDVDGCLSADPRRVPGAYVIPDISYNEASELSYFGAKVIHPKVR